MVDTLSHACREFGLTISITMTNVIAQGADSSPNIYIGTKQLVVTDDFTYLSSSMAYNLSIDKEINSRIAKAAGVMANSIKSMGKQSTD